MNIRQVSVAFALLTALGFPAVSIAQTTDSGGQGTGTATLAGGAQKAGSSNQNAGSGTGSGASGAAQPGSSNGSSPQAGVAGPADGAKGGKN